MHPFYTDDPDPDVRERAQGLLRLKRALDDTHARKRHKARSAGRRVKATRPLEEFDTGPLTALTAPKTGYQYASDAGPRVPPRARTAKFWEVIGPQPLCTGNERWRAKLYHDAILRAMDSDEWLTWRRSEREQLRQLELRWRRRASGQDVRFDTVGNRVGRLKPEEREAVKRAKLSRIGAL